LLKFLSPIHKASRQIAVHFESSLAEMQVSPQEGHVLSYLRSYAPCRISEIARVFELKGSTLTSMLDRLEKRDLIRRRVNPDDRRSFVIELSRGGRRLANRIQQHVDEIEAQIGSRVRADELEGFQAVMSAIDEATQVKLRER
jgi:DNA-binding MarR family transcriptional regulator